MELHPYLFCLSFCLLYFFLPPFEDNGLLFWVPDVLCQHSEVVLWNLLSVQMFFWWICGGESGLPILFLCHLKTAPLPCFFHSGFKKWNEHFSWHYNGAKQAFSSINWCHLLVINPAEIQNESQISKRVSRECEDIWTEEKAAEGTKDPKGFLEPLSFNKPVV